MFALLLVLGLAALILRNRAPALPASVPEPPLPEAQPLWALPREEPFVSVAPLPAATIAPSGAGVGGRSGPGSWAREIAGEVGRTQYVQIGSTALNVPVEGAPPSYFESVWKRRIFMFMDFTPQFGKASMETKLPWDTWDYLYEATTGLYPDRRFGQSGIPFDARRTYEMNIEEWFSRAFPDGWRVTPMRPQVLLQYGGGMSFQYDPVRNVSTDGRTTVDTYGRKVA